MINEKFHYLESRGCVVLLALSLNVSICRLVTRFASPTRLSPTFPARRSFECRHATKVTKTRGILTLTASKHSFQLLPLTSRCWQENSRDKGTKNLQITRGDNSNMKTTILIFKNYWFWLPLINCQNMDSDVWKVSGIISKRGGSILPLMVHSSIEATTFRLNSFTEASKYRVKHCLLIYI
jgi:hypothetical protein